MQISGRQIGPGVPPYIIAELGVNHDGDPDKALALVDAAADAGADAVKLQLFRADLLMSRASRLAQYQADAGERDPQEMLRRLELTVDQMAPIVARAKARGVHAIVTVFSVELVREAENLTWDAYKTASPDIIHRPLLEALMHTGKPLIVSTGAATLDEVQRAVTWLSSAGDRLSVLQCVSCYPTALDQAELGGIIALQRALAQSISAIGYSDHTASEETGALAVALGARILEKHFTLDRNAPGPDHRASLEPDGMRRYIQLARRAGDFVRDARLMTIDIAKRVLPVEQDVRAVSRQSIVTRRALTAGHILTPQDLTFKRPGTGLPPCGFTNLIGRPLVRAVSSDTPLMPSDVVGLSVTERVA